MRLPMVSKKTNSWQACRNVCLIGLVLLALCTCRRGDRIAQPEGAIAGTWYSLQNGSFREVSAPGAVKGSSPVPWTVQTRVADMVRQGSRVFLAVNGHGIAQCVLLEDTAKPVFTYHYEPIVFRFRTITLLLPYQGTILCHLYFNRTLNTAKDRDLTVQGVSFLRFLPAEETFRFVILPFQKRNPDWEAPAVVPIGEGQFYVQWKYTDDRVSRFEYTQFDVASESEEPGSEQQFRRAFRFQDSAEPRIQGSLGDLLESTAAVLWKQSPRVAIHYLVRSTTDGITRRYTHGVSGSDASVLDAIVSVPVYGDAGSYYALLPDGTLVWSREQGGGGVLSLPSLPASFSYTNLVKKDTFIIASWEESVFYNVGRAGIFVGRLPSP